MGNIEIEIKISELIEEYEFTKLYDTYDEDKSTLQLIANDITYYRQLKT